ncbi:MAG: hypothetical protein GY727_07735 [Gammaproteobacteria bacterium]|nr:hypothetical protein [Gammaproteobacteria bacterium]MCP4090173.1 hypothetical protein [Gammaproteobacteria bacterium]MCP4277944.1 hypothetical protein [Gammaproteobacteria bacterium]MCP4832539.1 hypothetical protein [Gammaproteobacteria bacterium]MCP4928679.1 hypothetical protein [Gammaproteobacteria bacterium]
MSDEVARLKSTFSPATKQRISQFLESFKSFKPTLGLLYGDLAGQVTGRASWSITALGSRTVDDMVELYGSFGAVVCYELDGFSVVVPQIAHLAELDGGVLEFRENRLVATLPSDA